MGKQRTVLKRFWDTSWFFFQLSVFSHVTSSHIGSMAQKKILCRKIGHFPETCSSSPHTVQFSFSSSAFHVFLFFHFSFETSICVITGFTSTYSFIYSCPVFLSRLFLLFKRLYFNDCLTHFGGSILVVLKRVLIFSIKNSCVHVWDSRDLDK